MGLFLFLFLLKRLCVYVFFFFWWIRRLYIGICEGEILTNICFSFYNKASLEPRLRLYLCFFFIFHVFVRLVVTVLYCAWTVTTKFDFSYFFNPLVHTIHYLWIHKFHFSIIFSLKIGSTVLFIIHTFKIILL